jgi:hypothetical protein
MLRQEKRFARIEENGRQLGGDNGTGDFFFFFSCEDSPCFPLLQRRQSSFFRAAGDDVQTPRTVESDVVHNSTQTAPSRFVA